MSPYPHENNINGGFDVDELDLDANFQVGAVIRRYLREGLKRAGDLKGISRCGVAERMTELLGEPISESMLNKYTRKKDAYRFPLEWLPAFCKATGDFRLIGFIPGIFGMRVLDSKESIMKEIREVEKIEEQVKKKRNELMNRLEEIESPFIAGGDDEEISKYGYDE